MKTIINTWENRATEYSLRFNKSFGDLHIEITRNYIKGQNIKPFIVDAESIKKGKRFYIEDKTYKELIEEFKFNHIEKSLLFAWSKNFELEKNNKYLKQKLNYLRENNQIKLKKDVKMKIDKDKIIGKSGLYIPILTFINNEGDLEIDAMEMIKTFNRRLNDLLKVDE